MGFFQKKKKKKSTLHITEELAKCQLADLNVNLKYACQNLYIS